MTTTDADTQQLRNGTAAARPGKSRGNQRPKLRGAPANNRNAQRHGLRSQRLPAGCGWIRTRVNELRLCLEDAVLARVGYIDPVAAGYIATAARWEQHSMLAGRWLRVAFDELSWPDRLAFSRDHARASAERDRAIAALGIDKQQGNVFDALSAPVGDHAEESPQRAHHGDETESSDKLPANAGNAKSGLSGALDAGGSQVGDSTP